MNIHSPPLPPSQPNKQHWQKQVGEKQCSFVRNILCTWITFDGELHEEEQIPLVLQWGRLARRHQRLRSVLKILNLRHGSALLVLLSWLTIRRGGRLEVNDCPPKSFTVMGGQQRWSSWYKLSARTLILICQPFPFLGGVLLFPS